MKVSDASQSNNPTIKRAVKKYLFQQNYQKSIDKYIELENNETKLMLETSSRYIPSIDKKYTDSTDYVSDNNLDDSSVCEFKKEIVHLRRKMFQLFGLNPDEYNSTDISDIEESVNRILNDIKNC